MNIKKILLSAVCILAVAGISVMGTLAYLTDSTEAVINTFTMGNVDIKLDEVVVDANGVADASGKRTEEGNEYKMIPGKSYDKDPTVTVVKGSEESYVRMLLTVNCWDKINAICDPYGDTTLGAFFEGYDTNVWVPAGETDNGDNTHTYEFRYYTTVSAAEAIEDVKLKPLFTKFKVPGFFTGDDLAKLVDFKITVNAHAIQATGFEADADAAWAAFDAQVDTTAGSGNSGAQTPTT